jgi:hypothetical protein
VVTSFRYQIVLSHDGRIGSRIVNKDFHQRLIAPEKSWYSQDKNQGVPIGSLTSQFGSNLYLNGLDQFILRDLKPRKYIRYMDDLILLDTDPEKLKSLIDPISAWLKTNRNQDLNHNKTNLVRLDQGTIYLGVFCKQTDSPQAPLIFLPTRKRKWNIIKSIHACENADWQNSILFHELAFPCKWRNNKLLSSLNSQLGLIKHTKSYSFRKKGITKLLNRITQNVNEPKQNSTHWTPLKAKKYFTSITWR